jgi:hypothetical protein
MFKKYFIFISCLRLFSHFLLEKVCLLDTECKREYVDTFKFITDAE